jgi:DNA-binding SARP family transcriptional activator
MAHAQRLGAGRTALGLFGLAEIDRLHGQDERAGAAYEEAIALARASGELQVLVPSLAGLARLRARSGASEAAALLAAEAESVATPALLPSALVASGWIAYRQGNGAEGAARAQRAAQLAGAVGAHDLAAEALELVGVASQDPTAARTAFGKALTVWRDGGARPRAARVELALGRLRGADGSARSRSRDAARLLQQLGVLGIDELPVEVHQPAPVAISVLGGFTVRVGAEPVPLPAWRSRQARTLVRILAARRGRPVTRERLCELLWPDDDPARTGHRLSVLLATVRGVLDPARAWPTDRFIVADSAGLRLDSTHVAVDADQVLHDASAGAEQMEAGNDERALEILADVDLRYTGDAFEDDVGEEWADAFREEVRGAWLRSLRRLAVLQRRRGGVDDAQATLLRLLASDPYDEQSHAILVRLLTGARRHGEARRAFLRWCDAMAAIDAPAPDPIALDLTRARDRRTERGPSRPVVGQPRLVPRPAL